MESFLECPVCFLPYSKKQIPKVLECGHTLCVACVEQIAGEGKQQCPECRTDFLLPVTGADALTTNLSVLQQFDKQTKPKHPTVVETLVNQGLQILHEEIMKCMKNFTKVSVAGYSKISSREVLQAKLEWSAYRDLIKSQLQDDAHTAISEKFAQTTAELQSTLCTVHERYIVAEKALQQLETARLPEDKAMACRRSTSALLQLRKPLLSKYIPPSAQKPCLAKVHLEVQSDDSSVNVVVTKLANQRGHSATPPQSQNSLFNLSDVGDTVNELLETFSKSTVEGACALPANLSNPTEKKNRGQKKLQARPSTSLKTQDIQAQASAILKCHKDWKHQGSPAEGAAIVTTGWAVKFLNPQIDAKTKLGLPCQMFPSTANAVRQGHGFIIFPYAGIELIKLFNGVKGDELVIQHNGLYWCNKLNGKKVYVRVELRHSKNNSECVHFLRSCSVEQALRAVGVVTWTSLETLNLQGKRKVMDPSCLKNNVASWENEAGKTTFRKLEAKAIFVNH